MPPGTDSADPVVVCVGDSAIWCTGTRYEDKTPNLVHRMLTGPTLDPGTGNPMPPVQFRARGGAIIGVDYPWRIQHRPNGKTRSNWRSKLGKRKNKCSRKTSRNGFHADDCKLKVGQKIQLNRNAKYLDPNGDYYGFIKAGAAGWYDYYANPPDKSDINQRKWTIARDIGWHWPRIVDQIEQFPSRRAGDSKPSLDVPAGTISLLGGVAKDEPPFAEDVDVVLINGGTNDIELGWLNDPTKVGRTGVRQATRKHCYEDQKELLKKARQGFPNAVILVVGYYPYASDWTSRQKAKQFLSAQAGIAGAVGATVEGATDNALNFARFQAHWMRKAVAEVARTDDGPGIVFVSRGFGVINAFDAPEPFSWGAPAHSTDDTGELRAETGQNITGEANTCRIKHDSHEASCAQASIGHPNTAGCKHTAEAIVDRYTEYVDLSLRETVEGWDDSGSTSVRGACENYDLDPAGDGVRYCLSHRLVDSIRVEVETGSSLKGVRSSAGGGTGAADPKNDVYLELHPGRNGSGERFRLETEYNDFKSGSTSTFSIDPMMGRKITADVGPVPESHGMDSGTWQHQRKLKGKSHGSIPYSSQEGWDTKRLRLGDIERITLVVEDTKPWALEGVTVELNGFIQHSRRINHGPKGVSGDRAFDVWTR